MRDPSRYGIRLALADVKGISDDEVARIVTGQPYRSLTDFWHRASVSRPVVERLVLAGGFDSLYGFGVRDREAGRPTHRRKQVTRRDLLLQIGELDRWSRSGARASSSGQLSLDLMGLELAGGCLRDEPEETGPGAGRRAAGCRSSPTPNWCAPSWRCSAWTPAGTSSTSTGRSSRRSARSRRGSCSTCRSGAEVLVAGVKVATQTPPIRSGRRVVFVTLDDGSGCTDSTFFEDAQGPYAATVFHSWLLVIRGVLRRTGPRGVSLRATGAWELPALHEAWEADGLEGVRELMAAPGEYHRAGDRRGRGVPRARGRSWSGRCWSTRPASGCRPTPTSSRPGRTRRPPPAAPRPARPASSGTPAPAAPATDRIRRRR